MRSVKLLFCLTFSILLLTGATFAQDPVLTDSMEGKVFEFVGDNGSSEIIPEPTPTPTPLPEGKCVLKGIVHATGASNFDPVAGAKVVVSAAHEPTMETGADIPELIFETVTDENGFYQIEDIPYGKYFVKAAAEGYIPSTEIMMLYAPDIKKDILLFEKTSAETGNLGGHTWRNPEEYMITVMIPVRDAHIRVYKVWNGTMHLIRETVSDYYGVYWVPDLPYGKYLVTASAKYFYPEKAHIDINAPEIEHTFILSSAPSPPPGDIGVLKGRVVQGFSSDSTLPPIPDALIQVFALDSPTTPMPVRSTRTNGNGEYAIYDLPYGNYAVMAGAQGYAPDSAIVKMNAPEVIQNFSLIRIEPTPTPTPIEYGSLEGFVWEAAEDSSTPPVPIKGARVRIFTTWKPGAESGSIEDKYMFKETLTDEKGYYMIEDIPYGLYVATAEAAGYYRKISEKKVDQPLCKLDFHLVKKAEPSPTPTPTPTGEDGKVYGKVEGIDPETSETIPLVGAVLELFPPVDCGAGTKCYVPPVKRVITDENGMYVMEGIKPLPWELKARARGYIPGMEAFDMTPGGEIEINFLLEPGEYPKPGVIHGRVMGLSPDTSTGTRPVEHAKVEVFYPPVYESDNADNDETLIPGEKVAETWTDENGFYKIGNLENGFFIVKASHPRFHPEHKPVAVYSSPVEVNFKLRPMLEPTPTPVGCVIRGRVVEAIPGAEEASSMPLPIEGAEVRIEYMGRNNSDESPEPVIVYTNERGFYKAEGLLPRPCKMIVRARGYQPAFRHVRLHPGEIKIVHFALRPILVTPTPVPGEGALFGHVFEIVPRSIDHPTSPIEGALVSVFPVRQNRNDWSGREPLFETETVENGAYRFEAVPEGHYLVVAQAAGFLRKVKHVEIPPNEKVRLDFGLIPVVEPTPTPAPEPGSVEGTVLGVDPDGDFNPVAGAEVLLFGAPRMETGEIPAPDHRALTDDNGNFFMDEIPAGGYMMVVRAEGFKPCTERLFVKPGEVTEVIVKLFPVVDPTPTPPPEMGSLEGHVWYEEEGERIPVPSAHMVAVRMDSSDEEMLSMRPAKHTATDEFGFYRFDELLTGKHLVMAMARGFKPAKQEAEIVYDTTTILDFVLEMEDQPSTDTGTIYGRVMTLDDATTGMRPVPLEGAEVVALKVIDSLEVEENLVPAGKAVSDENGIFVIDNLSHGVYVLIARKDGYEKGIKKVRVRHLAETRVRFLLLPEGMEDPEIETASLMSTDFSDDSSWEPGGAPSYYNMPQATRDTNRLALRSSENGNSYGFWRSPFDAIPVESDMLYKATFEIATDVADPSKVPAVRLRFNSRNEQAVDTVAIFSKEGGEASPGTGGRIYTHYFSPPVQEIVPPDTENNIYVSFDLINIGGEDAPDATVWLKWVNIEAIAPLDLTQLEPVMSSDFASDTGGWKNLSAGIYSTPEFINPTQTGGLTLKATGNADNYGGWYSSTDSVTIQPGTLYAVSWDIFSDQIDSSVIPGLRLRASDLENRYIAQKSLFSNLEGDNSPGPLGRKCMLYYSAPEELAGSELYLAFDMVNFNINDSEDAAVGVRKVKVFAVPLP